MKQIKENENHTVIILEDGDIIDICKMGKNSTRTQIKCISNTLHFDEITYKELQNLIEEKKAISVLDKYLKQKK